MYISTYSNMYALIYSHMCTLRAHVLLRDVHLSVMALYANHIGQVVYIYVYIHICTHSHMYTILACVLPWGGYD